MHFVFTQSGFQLTLFKLENSKHTIFVLFRLRATLIDALFRFQLTSKVHTFTWPPNGRFFVTKWIAYLNIRFELIRPRLRSLKCTLVVFTARNRYRWIRRLLRPIAKEILAFAQITMHILQPWVEACLIALLYYYCLAYFDGLDSCDFILVGAKDRPHICFGEYSFLFSSNESSGTL